MRPCVLTLTLGLVGLGLAGLAPGHARAQEGLYAYYADYNAARAYRHFLNSPYSYRTYSTTSPGYVAEGPTPYGGYVRFWRTPGYLNERITTHGYQRFEVVPGGGSYEVIPGVLLPYLPPPYVPYRGPFFPGPEPLRSAPRPVDLTGHPRPPAP
jgi:hypothetical protein